MLVIDISINRKHKISTIGAVRIDPKSEVGDSDLCTYEYGRVYDGKIKRPMGITTHIYGDGAEILAAKVLGLVSESDITALHEHNLERLIDIAGPITREIK